MKRLVFVLGCLVALLACSPQNDTAKDPLAPARVGKLICAVQAGKEKLCTELTQLTFKPDGSVSSHAVVLMSDQPRLVLTADFPVTLKDGAFCGSIRAEDVDTAKLSIEGVEVDAERANQFRAQMKANIQARGIGEGCLKPTPRDGGFIQTVTFDGVTRPELAYPMIWVRPEDGYAVR